MDYKDHCLRVGYIHTNLAALESSLRFFLLKVNGQTFSAPKAGDVDAPVNYITKYASLGGLIKKYNGALTNRERIQDHRWVGAHTGCLGSWAPGGTGERLSTDIVEVW
jgi:hypothetical protein